MNFAGAHDAEERTALFTTLAGRLLDDTLSESGLDRAHLLRLLSSLLQVADRDARRAFIEQTAQQATPPKDLAMVLARDDADLAGPVLRDVPFTQKELIELVIRTGPEHHIEIAKRADLTLDVWLALARAAARRGHKGDNIASNKPASHSQDGPSMAPAAPAPEPLGTGNRGAQKDSALAPCKTVSTSVHEGLPPGSLENPTNSAADLRSSTRPVSHDSDHEDFLHSPVMGPQEDQSPQAPLNDSDTISWRFETTRNGRIYRLSPNAQMAFGPGTHGLVGEYFAPALQSRAAMPCADEVGEAMARRAPLRDIAVETMTTHGQSRRWSLRGRPRFSFPDGRFEGYSGVARDLDTRHDVKQAPEHAGELLNRMARAADRLAEETSSPELEDYARTMRDCVEALMSMPVSFRLGGPFKDERNKD